MSSDPDTWPDLKMGIFDNLLDGQKSFEARRRSYAEDIYIGNTKSTLRGTGRVPTARVTSSLSPKPDILHPGLHRLVTSGCWRLFAGDNFRVLVTSFGFSYPTLILKNRECWWRERPKLSPTSHSCRQHISSSTVVTNIEVATSCSNWDPNQSQDRWGELQLLDHSQSKELQIAGHRFNLFFNITNCNLQYLNGICGMMHGPSAYKCPASAVWYFKNPSNTVIVGNYYHFWAKVKSVILCRRQVLVKKGKSKSIPHVQMIFWRKKNCNMVSVFVQKGKKAQ